MPESPDLSFAINLPPEQAVNYFREKGYEIGFRWQDVAADAHARAFTAAGVMKTDILETIREEVDSSIEKGLPFNQFLRNLEPRLRAKGFWGKQEIMDPETGELRTIDVNPHRLRNIWRTNMQVARSVGRFREQVNRSRTHPYWMYLNPVDGRERPEHGKRNRDVYRFDDPVWKWMYPPNGWGCRCWIRSITLRELERLGLKVLDGAKVKRFTPEAWSHNPGELYGAPRPGQMESSLPESMAPAISPHVEPVAPQAVSESALLGDGLSDEQYLQAFLGEFDATLDRPAEFVDAVGESLLIGSHLFQGPDGALRARYDGRETWLPLLADTLRDPHEIRMQFQQIDGRLRATRRYYKMYRFPGSDEPVLVVFQMNRDGWIGVTGYRMDPQALALLNAERQKGYPLFRKPTS